MLINQEYPVLDLIEQKTSTYMSYNSTEFRENLGGREEFSSHEEIFFSFREKPIQGVPSEDREVAVI